MYQRFLGFLGICLWVVGMVGVVAAAPTKPEEPVPTTAVSPLAVQTLLPDPTAPQGCNPLTPSFQISPNLVITDLNTITSTMNISGVDPYVWDVNLFTNIEHTFPGDLEIFIISPTGTEVTISTDNLSTHDNAFANTTWDDQWVGSSISDWPFTVVEEASPEGALGAFVGEDPNGTWQLVVHDDAEDDVGVLVQWRLEFTTLAQAPLLQTNSYSQLGGAIPDEGELSRGLLSQNRGRIYDLNLKADLGHPRTGDLDIYLAHETGITITLTSDVGANVANGVNGTSWDDSAGIPVTDWVFGNGTPTALVPENGMGAFNGLEARGLWTLVVVDDTAGNTGTLGTWGITITTATCAGDAAVEQWHWPYPAPVGGDVGYAIVVSNEGLNPLNSLVLTDTLPVSTTFKSWTAAPGWDCQTPAVGSTEQVVCTTPSLAVGEVFTHYLTVATAELVPVVVQANFVEITTADPEISLSNSNDEIDHYMGLTSVNGNVWDVVDNRFGWWDSDDGGHFYDGGQDAFDGWGYLRVLVADENQNELTNEQVTGLGMTYGGNRTWASQQGFFAEGIQIGRQVVAPAEANYVRYVDTFTNEGTAVRHVSVAWGGNLGSDNSTTLAATSSGDLAFDAADEWAVTIQSDGFNPAGPAIDPPVGYLWRGPEDASYQGTSLYKDNVFDAAWPGNGEDDLGYLFQLTLQPGETATLVYFVYRGLAEEMAGPGTTNWGYTCLFNCVVPPAGSEIALAQTVLGQLAAEPDFCGIPEDVLATVVNWPNAVSSCPSGYPIYLPLITR
ncbi:MAG: proprotein convertase P-domain-containing protein [Chloroflexi bacterium]|nr:proprotein convertase P-domain-containing protein [Chloroflexota bacterium]